MRLPVFAVCLLLGAASAAAQDTSIVIHPESSGVNIAPGQLPRLVAEEVVRFYNAATTSRLVGRTLLPKGNGWRGDGAAGAGPALGPGREPQTVAAVYRVLLVDRGGQVTGADSAFGRAAAPRR